MKGKRVMLVDDSVVVRKLVSDLLARQPGIEAVITASNGRLALEKLEREEADLLILDVEMPEVDGIEVLRRLGARSPHLPVLMFSALTERAGALTLEALSLGAKDYVTKPSNVGPAHVSLAQVQQQLVAKVSALLNPSSVPPEAASLAPVPSATPPSFPQPSLALRPEVIVIGASTGGPNAVAEILADLPDDLGIPIVIAQHMPPLFTRLFAERLDRCSHLTVREATGRTRLLPGQAWVAPGDYHVVLEHTAAVSR